MLPTLSNLIDRETYSRATERARRCRYRVAAGLVYSRPTADRRHQHPEPHHTSRAWPQFGTPREKRRAGLPREAGRAARLTRRHSGAVPPPPSAPSRPPPAPHKLPPRCSPHTARLHLACRPPGRGPNRRYCGADRHGPGRYGLARPSSRGRRAETPRHPRLRGRSPPRARRPPHTPPRAGPAGSPFPFPRPERPALTERRAARQAGAAAAGSGGGSWAAAKAAPHRSAPPGAARPRPRRAAPRPSPRLSAQDGSPGRREGCPWRRTSSARRVRPGQGECRAVGIGAGGSPAG